MPARSLPHLVRPFPIAAALVSVGLAGLLLLASGPAGAAPSSPAAPSPEEGAADLVLRQGTFYPVATPGSVEGSLAVRGGEIVYLGDDAGAAAWIGEGTEVVDLAGRAVTPGLIDAHSHLVGLGDALVQVDLVGAASYGEVIRRVREAAAEAAPGSWVQGRGWDQNLWSGKEFPHHRELSAAVPDHPVWMTRVDGHAALVNARAMELLGIDAAVTDPSGGRFLRGEDGEPTGVLIDRAMGIADGAIPPPPAEERQRRLRLAGERAASLGLTTVTDMGVTSGMVADYRALVDAGQLPVRAALFLTDDLHLLNRWFGRGPQVDPQGRLTVRGIKLYADGALGSRGAALVEPYEDDPGNLGLLTTTGRHIHEVARRALESGFQVGIHAIGDRGALVTLDALDRAFAEAAAEGDGQDPAEARFRLEHAQVMRLADIERAARLGVIFSVQPTHATSDMGWAGDRVGAERLAGAYAWRRQLQAGGQLALGSDFPVESPDPRLGLYAAVTRQDGAGEPAGGWLPDQVLTREEALRGFTLDAARSLFLEDLVGSLEVGKRADLVVFARDIVQVPAEEIPQVEVDLTVLDGEVVYRRAGATSAGASPGPGRSP